jgi:hypothetical protein
MADVAPSQGAWARAQDTPGRLHVVTSKARVPLMQELRRYMSKYDARLGSVFNRRRSLAKRLVSASWPKPEAGQVIRYACLWNDEAEAGHKQVRKVGDAAVILVLNGDAPHGGAMRDQPSPWVDAVPSDAACVYTQKWYILVLGGFSWPRTHRSP